MDAMFNVFGFGMSSPEDKYKFFEQKKDRILLHKKKKYIKVSFGKKILSKKLNQILIFQVWVEQVH